MNNQNYIIDAIDKLIIIEALVCISIDTHLLIIELLCDKLLNKVQSTLRIRGNSHVKEHHAIIKE